MPNIAVTFRQEIIRLARKEIRRETKILRKASAQYRSLIAELKRETKELKSDVFRFALQASSPIAQPPTPAFAGAMPKGANRQISSDR